MLLIFKLIAISIFITQNITWAFKPLQQLKDWILPKRKFDTELKPIKERFFIEMLIYISNVLNCSKCLAVWVGFALAIMFQLVPLDAVFLTATSFITNTIFDYKWRSL